MNKYISIAIIVFGLYMAFGVKASNKVAVCNAPVAFTFEKSLDSHEKKIALHFSTKKQKKKKKKKAKGTWPVLFCLAKEQPVLFPVIDTQLFFIVNNSYCFNRFEAYEKRGPPLQKNLFVFV